MAEASQFGPGDHDFSGRSSPRAASDALAASPRAAPRRPATRQFPRPQLLTNCLKSRIILSDIPDLGCLPVHDCGFAIFAHAAEPPAVIKRLPQLFLANAIMPANLHWAAATRAL